MDVSKLDTPVAIVDLDLLEKNIHSLQNYLSSHQIKNRPHSKTHKIPEIAHMQIAAGAVGICCQKVGEAEVMVQAGIKDIFMPYNFVGEAKLERLMNLAKRAKISVAADSEQVVHGLADAAKRAQVQMTVLVEFDGGGLRCGTDTPEKTALLAKYISRFSDLHFGGIMTFPSNDKTDSFVRATKEILNSKGLNCEVVSGGGTQVCYKAHQFKEVTEHRAGMYIYGDRNTVNHNTMKLDECSFKVITTVVSRPNKDRVITDGGTKIFSSDLLGLEGHGVILGFPEAKFYGASEEHGHLDFSGCSTRPEIGERLTIIPNHCCPVSNLVDEVVGIRKGNVEIVWPVLARGKLK